MAPFGEVLTAMATPMGPDGSVDFNKAAELARFLIDNGSDGLVVSGTTGESPTLTVQEKLELFRTVVQAVGARAQVIAGTGSYSTRDSVELTRQADSTGVHGIMAVVPYYNKPPQEGLYYHFRAIAEATSLPMMLYNVPTRTSCNLEPDTVARLAALANVVAIKEAAGDMEQLMELRRKTDERFAIYSGEDSLTLAMLALGAKGVVSVASHVIGKAIKGMIQTFKSGDYESARAQHERMLPVFHALFVTTNPIPVKWAMSLLGMDLGPFRLPLIGPTPAQMAHIEDVLQRYGAVS